MFLDKGNLLSELKKAGTQPGVSWASLYSHRSYGKTRLFQELSKERRVLYFRVSNLPYQENFLLLRRLCAQTLEPSFTAAKNFTELLRRLAGYSAAQPLTVVFDDFHYLGAFTRRFPSILASLEEKQETNACLFLLFCKPLSRFEKEGEKDKKAFCLRPFTFFELRRLYPAMEIEEQLLLYSVTGGVPGYLKFFPPGCSVPERLEALFFQESGALYRLPPARIREEYGSSDKIPAILFTLGDSMKKLQEVCSPAGLTPSAGQSLLHSLTLKGFVQRIIPVTESPGSRRTLYQLFDGVFRFWYTFVFPHRSEIELGDGHTFYQTQVLPHLDAYLKPAFETVCREFLALQDCCGDSPFPLSSIGMWWGQHPTKKRSEYVSIAAAQEHNILLGSCLWTDLWVDADALSPLQKHATLFPHSQQWYYLFAKSGFVSGMETISGNNVRVYSLPQMCAEAEKYLSSSPTPCI